MPAVIAISGPPGAGKSTTAKLLLQRLKELGYVFERFPAGEYWRSRWEELGRPHGTLAAWYDTVSLEENIRFDERQAEFMRAHNTISEGRFSALVCGKCNIPYIGIMLILPLAVRSQRSGTVTQELIQRQAKEEHNARDAFGHSYLENGLYQIIVETTKTPDEVVSEIMSDKGFQKYLAANYVSQPPA